MSTEDKIQRSILPIPDRPYMGLTTYDAKDPDTKFPPIEQLRPPKGAPNVLIILIDDAGFGSSSAFGGPCQTPNAEKLAAGGLKYNRFHTTALCSPTRQALLTGRNHHSAGMGGITEIATGAPGYSSVLPNTMAPLARTLKLNGYSTAQFGKCHEVPVWETSPVGPFDAWPTGGGGFEYFYGFIGGEANQWYPTLYEGTTPVEPKKTPEEGYHFMEDMTDKAIGLDRAAEGPGARQAVLRLLRARRHPCAAPRAEGMGRQVQGQVRPGLGQAARRDLRPAEEARRHPGGLPSSPRATRRSRRGTTCRRRSSRCCAGRWRSTRASWSTPTTTSAVCSTAWRSSASSTTRSSTTSSATTAPRPRARSTARSTRCSTSTAWPPSRRRSSCTARIDKFGGPESYNHYAVGWAHAMDTPYQWTKQVASHWGGTRNGTIVHWPKGIKAKGEMRCAVPPRDRRGADDPGGGRAPRADLGERRAAAAHRGREHALLASTTPRRAERHETQYFEMFGNRGIYHKGWTAVTQAPDALAAHRPRRPPPSTTTSGSSTTRNKDWSQANDLSKQMPEKLHELQRLWLIEAVKYNVLPLDDRPRKAHQPGHRRPADADQGEDPASLRRHGAPVGELRRQHQEQVPRRHRRDRRAGKSGAEGVIIAQGANIGGWSLYAKDGKLKYCYNLGGVQHFYVEADEPDPRGRAPGAHGVRLRRRRPGQGRQGDAVHRRQEGRRRATSP